MKRLMALVCLVSICSCTGITCNQNRHRAIRYMNRGVKNFSDGAYAEALTDLKAAIREDNSFAKAHYNLAKVYQHMKKWDDAQRHLNQVVALAPDNAVHYYELGKCYQNLNRLDMAKNAYVKALELNDQLYVAYYRLGTIYSSMDQPRRADASYRKALEINPRFTKGFVSLAMLYLNYDYPEEAIQVLENAVAINDSSAEARNILGVSYQFLEQYDKAVDSFSKALQLKPDLYVAVFNLGMALAAADKNEAAERQLTRFTRAASGKRDIDPDYIREANEKIMELQGLQEPDPDADASLPQK